jgi:hypothetical protein
MVGLPPGISDRDHPASTGTVKGWFVATLLESPVMNLIEGRTGGACRARLALSDELVAPIAPAPIAVLTRID